MWVEGKKECKWWNNISEWGKKGEQSSYLIERITNFENYVIAPDISDDGMHESNGNSSAGMHQLILEEKNRWK